VSSNPMLSLTAAIAVSIAGSSLARAENPPASDPGAQTASPETKQSDPTISKKTGKKKKHANKTELDKLERGNPHSVIYKSRKKTAPNPTNEQVEAGEKGNPDAVPSAGK